MNFERISLEKQGNLAVITLSRPPMNVIDISMMAEIHSALDLLQKDNEVILVVFRGAGEKAFSAGVDIADHTPEKVEKMLVTFHRIFKRLHEGPWITASLIHGYCLGGGAEMALFCDFPVAEEDAVIGQPEVKVGCFPPVAAAFFPGRIGWTRSCDLIFTGRNLSGEEAHRIGLVHRVVPRGSLDEALHHLHHQLSQLSPAVLRLTRRAMTDASSLPFTSALDYAERVYLDELTSLSDMTEGLQAFVERRPPIWKNA